MKSRQESAEDLLRENAALRRRVADLEREAAAATSATSATPAPHGLFEALPHGVEECDRDGTIRYANQACHRLLGVPMGSLVGTKLWDLLPDTTAKDALQAQLQFLLDEEPEANGYRLHHRRPDGSSVELSVDWAYRRDSDGKVCGFYALLRDTSTEARLQRALELSDETFQAFTRHLPGAAFIKDADGRYIFVNQTAASVLGGTPTEIVGQSDAELFPRDVAETLRKHDQRAMRESGPLRTIEYIPQADGLHQWIVIRFRISTEEREQDCLAGIALDMTQRFDLHEVLRLNKDRLEATGQRLELLSSVMDRSGAGLAVASIDGRIDYANDVLARMLGRSVDELEGCDFFDLLAAESREQAKDLWTRFDRDGETRVEMAFESIRGRSMHCQLALSHLAETPKQAASVAIVIRGVEPEQGQTSDQEEEPSSSTELELESRVERRTSELAEVIEQLRREVRDRKRAERELARVFDSSIELMALVDFEGNLKRCNASFERTFGYGVDELLDMTFEELVDREDRDTTHRLFDQLRLVVQPTHLTLRCRTKDGVIRLLEWYVAPVSDLSLIYFTARDVTDLRRAEERASRHQAELAHVTRLTSMGEMASGIAHELNQPLGAISLRAETCKLTASKAGPKHFHLLEDLDYIGHQAERAAEIIRRLRGFVTKRETERDLHSPNALIREVLSLMRVEAETHGVRVTTTLAKGLPRVLVDGIQIEQVILNLVRNSIDAMAAADSPRKELHVVSRLDSNHDIQVSVEDTGPGLCSDIAEHLFEPFFTTKANGLGIGLSLSKSILEAHGGSLHGDPDRKPGALFVMTLPQPHPGPKSQLVPANGSERPS